MADKINRSRIPQFDNADRSENRQTPFEMEAIFKDKRKDRDSKTPDELPTGDKMPTKSPATEMIDYKEQDKGPSPDTVINNHNSSQKYTR